MENKKASFQEFTDNNTRINFDGVLGGIGVLDHVTPLPDEQGRGPGDLQSGYDLADAQETSHKSDAKNRDTDPQSFPYNQSTGSREEEITDFTDNLLYEQSPYFNVQNDGNNIYFFMGSIPPHDSTVLKDATMTNEILLEVRANEDDSMESEIELDSSADDSTEMQSARDSEADSEAESEAVIELEPEHEHGHGHKESEHNHEHTNGKHVFFLSGLPGALPGYDNVELELEQEEEGAGEEVVAEIVPEQPRSKWDWKPSFPTGFYDWIQERSNSCPLHTGWDVGGIERACSYISKLDGEIGKAIRDDIDGHLDAQQIDDIRKQLHKGMDSLKSQLEKIEKLQSNVKKKKKAAEYHEMVKEAKMTPGVISTSINIPYLISSLASACIMSTVTAGHDMEEVFFKVCGKFKLSDHEKYQLRQCIADMGFQMQFDATTLVGEEVDNASEDNGEYQANYQGKGL